MHPDPAVTIRTAAAPDLGRIRDLAVIATHALCAPDYSPAQVRAALGFGLAADPLLVQDRTCYLIEHRGTVIATGAWSRRAALIGQSHPDYPGLPHDVLDPAEYPARLRAFFVHPEFTRRGLARLLLRACERDAARAGYTRAELLATQSARPFYHACGYTDHEPLTHIFPTGVSLPTFRMTRDLPTPHDVIFSSDQPPAHRPLSRLQFD